MNLVLFAVSTHLLPRTLIAFPQDAMIMGADYYESEEQLAATIAAGGVPIGIGENTVISNAIVDKNARIGKNVKIINKEVRRGNEGRMAGLAQ